MLWRSAAVCCFKHSGMTKQESLGDEYGRRNSN